MKKNESPSIAWSLYWSQDKLHSCVASGEDADQQVLELLWQDFAKSLGQDDRVLDLATGNGAVPTALLTSCPDLEIHAVDRAEIDPVKYLTNAGSLEAVTFYSETDIGDLPFEVESFAALTSQFGIEYAGLKQAGVAMMKLLQKGGKFQFIVHHKDSDIIQSSANKLLELEQLLRPEGLLDTLMKVMRGELDFSELELVGKAYLENDLVRTQAISGQIFLGINQLGQKLSDDHSGALDLAVAMNIRVRSEYQRLQEMADAAHDNDSMDEFVIELATMGVQADTLRPIFVDEERTDYLLGWLVVGTKS